MLADSEHDADSAPAEATGYRGYQGYRGYRGYQGYQGYLCRDPCRARPFSRSAGVSTGRRVLRPSQIAAGMPFVT